MPKAIATAIAFAFLGGVAREIFWRRAPWTAGRVIAILAGICAALAAYLFVDL